MFELENINFGYGAKLVLEDLSLNFKYGCFYGIIGPNGCGKTTLIDLLAGHLKPGSGCIQMDGRCLDQYDRKALARRIALVPQDYRINFPYTCKEIVMMGRYPHIPRFSRPAAHDRHIVKTVIQQADLEDFTDRYINRLSGGERQRVVFARGLAQETDALLLDEATANLDIQHTLGVLNLAAGRVTDQSLVIAVMQDINLAAMYCDRLVCLHGGKLFVSGTPEQVLTRQTLESVFNVETKVARHPYSGTLQVVFKKKGGL